MFTGLSPYPFHQFSSMLYLSNTHDYNKKVICPAAFGTEKALDVEENVLWLISTQQPWDFELSDYMDIQCLQVYIKVILINYVIITDNCHLRGHID